MGKVGVDLKILEIFRRNPSLRLSTSQIVSLIEKEEFEQIEKVLRSDFYPKEKKREALRKKAKLHRRILYYLNKLVKANLLAVYGEVGKGEKIFGLSLMPGEEITIEDFRRIKISIKPPSPALPIEGYEQKGIVKKYEEGTWINRVNSVLIEGNCFENLNSLFRYLNNSILLINDSLFVNEFEKFLDSEKFEISSFFSKISDLMNDFGKRIIFSIDLEKIPKDKHEKLELMIKLASSSFPRPSFVFSVNNKVLQEKFGIFSRILEILSNFEIPIFIKNSFLTEAPYFRGICGIYSFDEGEWRNYVENFKGSVKALSCSHFTIALDLARFAEEFKLRVYALEELLKKCCESMLIGSSIQRKKIDEYFKFLVKTNEKYEHVVFGLSRNYLRLWNYEWVRKNFDLELMLSVLGRIRKTVSEFSSVEETIYKSCGMPIRFRVIISSAVYEYYKYAFSKPEYELLKIGDPMDLYENQEVKKKLELSEKIANLFNGGHVTEIYKVGRFDPEELCREISYILGMYKLPFLHIDTSGIKKVNLVLTEFFKK